jgi:Helix-turn-helix domain
MQDGPFRVYAYLRSLADLQGNCRASGATIARALGKARSTVMEHINTLERLGWARRLRPAFRADGGKAANRYWVARETPADIPHVRPADMRDRAANRERSLLLPIDRASSPMWIQGASHDGPSDMACPPITDMHKEQTIRTDSLLPLGEEPAFDAFHEFRPDPETVLMGHEHVGSGGFEKLLAKWKDWHRANGKPFPTDPNASLRNWIRREPEISDSRGPSPSRPGCSPAKPHRSSIVQSALQRAKGS